MKFVLLMTYLISLPILSKEIVTILDQPQNQKWIYSKFSNQENVVNLLNLLARSETGKLLILSAEKKASNLGMTISDLIEPGNGSLTDTTLIRKFSANDPTKVSIETKSRIYINKNHETKDAILDLAHELTHFIFREGFNPYVVNFNLSDFIKNTVEGEGGEVHAFIYECKVHLELFPASSFNASQCSEIVDQKGQISKALTTKLFYQVGSYMRQLEHHVGNDSLKTEFPNINDNKIRFISSAYGVPYPLAAIWEYQSVLEKVCSNDKKRLVYMRQASTRRPASVDENVQKFEMDWNKRCAKID
jgi:hypothetical protein